MRPLRPKLDLQDFRQLRGRDLNALTPTKIATFEAPKPIGTWKMPKIRLYRQLQTKKRANSKQVFRQLQGRDLNALHRQKSPRLELQRLHIISETPVYGAIQNEKHLNFNSKTPASNSSASITPMLPPPLPSPTFADSEASRP